MKKRNLKALKKKKKLKTLDKKEDPLKNFLFYEI